MRAAPILAGFPLPFGRRPYRWEYFSGRILRIRPSVPSPGRGRVSAAGRAWPAAEGPTPPPGPPTPSTSADRVGSGPCHRWPSPEGRVAGPTDADPAVARGRAAEPPAGPPPRGGLPPPPAPAAAR